MVFFKKLKTDRLLLSPLTEAFLSEKYVAWLNDKDVVKYSEQRHKKHTIDSCRQFIRSFENSSGYVWAVLLKNHDHIGNINAVIDKHNKVADIAILIGEKNQWGNGYGSEAFLCVIDFLFSNKIARKITAGTMSVNKGMLKVMKNAQMIDDGIFQKQFVINEQKVDLVHKALFREDWLEKTEKL